MKPGKATPGNNRMSRNITCWVTTAMLLENLADIGEIIAALGVIASLVFAGVQLRQNTLAIKSQIHPVNLQR